MSYDQKNQYAMHLLSKGQVEEADKIFCEILAIDPYDADALHGRACVARAAQHPVLAIGLAGQAIQIKSEAHYYITLGLALYEADHMVEAQAALKSATLIAPYDARGHNALGMVQENMNLLPDAQFSYQRACELQPKNNLYWVDLTRYFWRHHDYDKALKNAQLGVKKNPGEIDFLHELGTILSTLELYGEAVLILKKIIRLSPKDMMAHTNLGGVYFQLGQFNLAKDYLLPAMKQDPLPLETSVNFALVQMALGYFVETYNILQEIYQEYPFNIKVGVNFGTILYELRHVKEAENLYKNILLQYKDQQLEVDYNWHQIRFNLGTALLAQGGWSDGWEAIESRYCLMNILENTDIVPMWDGHQIPLCLLIKGEQGLGDTIQFMRYLPFILKKCAIVVEVPDALVTLFTYFLEQNKYSYSWQVIGLGQATPQIITHQCGIMSLPYLLQQKNIPQCFLHIPQGKKEKNNICVGLCWSGNLNYRFDAIRSMSLTKISEITDIPNIHFYSLQYGIKSEHLPKNIHFYRVNDDVFKTALFIQTLDIVITVDTVIAHLAGAMGKPVWLLNRYGGDWRWYPSQLDENEKNKWYPTLRIFQQQKLLPPDIAWDQVVLDVKNALKDIF